MWLLLGEDLCWYNKVILVTIETYICTVKSHFTDTCLIWTPHYYGQFALSLGKESPYIFSKFDPHNTDTFYGPLSVCINWVSLHRLRVNNILLLQSTLSKLDTSEAGTKCPSKRDVRLMKSQIKGVKKARDQL